MLMVNVLPLHIAVLCHRVCWHLLTQSYWRGHCCKHSKLFLWNVNVDLKKKKRYFVDLFSYTAVYALICCRDCGVHVYPCRRWTHVTLQPCVSLCVCVCVCVCVRQSGRQKTPEPAVKQLCMCSVWLCFSLCFESWHFLCSRKFTYLCLRSNLVSSLTSYYIVIL